MTDPTGMTIEITNFANAAMVTDPAGAVAHMLRELADKIEDRGLSYVDGIPLRDYNGNKVGTVSVGFE